MKRKIYQSFRMKFVIYALVSLLLAMLTAGGIIGVGYIIYNTLNTGSTFLFNINQGKEMANEYLNSINNRYEQNLWENMPSVKPVETGINIDIDILSILSIVCLLGGFMLVLFTIYFLLFTKKFSNYLNEIAEGIRQFSSGSFEARISVNSNDELMEIADNLNSMALDIKSLIDKERRIENKKNDLITNVAHDLRTPLTSIIGYLDLVSNKELSDELRTKYITIAYSKSKRLENLIDDLFTYTKLEFGEIKPYLGEVDIIKMMKQMIDEFYPRFQENNLSYSFITNEKSLIINADGALLGRAFANLFENAIKYGIDGKDIIIKAEKNGNRAVVEIVNFGEIIPAEFLDDVFNKFYRIENSRNVHTGGTGLGLTITRNIIVMHKGRINVKSDLAGTVFSIDLPINVA